MTEKANVVQRISVLVQEKVGRSISLPRSFLRHRYTWKSTESRGVIVGTGLLALLLLWTSIATPAATAAVSPAPNAAEGLSMRVNASTVVNPFSPKMRGSQLSTWMHAANRKPGPNEHANLPEVVKPLRPGILRFAGGLWANRTGWDRSNTIQEWSPQVPWKWTDPATGQQFPYAYGHVYNAEIVDSLGRFSKAVAADVMVQIHDCDNNPAIWADMVRYANVEHDYGFTYWELSNELSLDENWRCLGLATEAEATQEYTRRFLEYRSVLTAVDPSIKLMGPVAHQPQNNEAWVPPLLEGTSRTGDQLDVVSWHRYPMWHDMTMANVEDRLFSITTRRAMIESVMANVQGKLAAYGFQSTETAITELNTHVSDFEPTNANHIGALWMLDVLPRYAYNGLDMNIWYNRLRRRLLRARHLGQQRQSDPRLDSPHLLRHAHALPVLRRPARGEPDRRPRRAGRGMGLQG